MHVRSHGGATCTTEELPCVVCDVATGERPPSTTERLCMFLYRYAVCVFFEMEIA